MKKTTIQKSADWIQGGFTIILLALLVLALFRPDLIETAIRKIGEISALLGHWNALILFASSTIESFPVIGVLVPGQQVMLVVGGFYGQNYFVFAFLSACLGAMLGNWSGYILGVYYGKYFLKNYGEAFVLGPIEQEILGKQIQKNGASFVIFGKFHNFTRAFVPFLAGSLNMSGEKFWRYNIIGSIIWSLTILILGVFFTKYVSQVLDWISWIFLGIFVLIALYITLFRKKEFLEYINKKTLLMEQNSQK